MTLHLQRLQDHAQSGTGPAQGVPGPTPHTRHMLHAVVAGLLHLVARVSGNEILQEHIQEVIARRQSSAPHLLPEGVFGVESSDGPVGPGEGEGEGEGEVDNELLFHLKPLIGMTPEVKRGFGKSPLLRSFPPLMPHPLPLPLPSLVPRVGQGSQSRRLSQRLFLTQRILPSVNLTRL